MGLLGAWVRQGGRMVVQGVAILYTLRYLLWLGRHPPFMDHLRFRFGLLPP